jgi:hypothetical protein
MVTRDQNPPCGILIYFSDAMFWRVEPRSQETRERDGPNLRSEVKQNA